MSNQISIQGKLLIKPKEDYKNEVKISDIMELVNGMSKTKRVTRDLHKIKEELEYNPDDYNINGYYYYPKNDFDNFGQTKDKSIVNINRPPMRAPSLWLDFEIIKEDNKHYLIWNGEKENNTIKEQQKWLMSLIDNVFNPVKISLNGNIKIIDEINKNEIFLEIKNNEIFKNNVLFYNSNEENLMAKKFFRNIIKKNQEISLKKKSNLNNNFELL